MNEQYVVGLPDTRGGMAWLAGYESDPTRYYTESCAMRFTTIEDAEIGITEAKLTHPFKERTYLVIPESEMHKYNLAQ